LTVVTASSCRIVRLPARHFLDLLRADVNLATTVQHLLSDEVIDQAARIAEFACLNARQRLENFIWRFTREIASTTDKSRLRLPLKQWEMAQFLAITPGYLCRLLDRLEADEIISRQNGWIVIPKHNKLWHRA